MNRRLVLWLAPAALLALVPAVVLSAKAEVDDPRLMTKRIVGKVVSIADGDTLVVLDSDKVQHRIRLEGIDAPERRQLLRFQREIGIAPPILVFVAMVGVKDYAMTVSSRAGGRGSDWNRVDRDMLLLPDAIVEDYSESPETILRPIFDVVWQSAGFRGSPNYDAGGKWIGR